MAKLKSFRYGRTIHLGPLSKQGRENWDIAFKKDDVKEVPKKDK